ncbi:UPF0755 protein [Neisseria sp. HSC-16F19]|nr:endolytic transglycosylase MltG [Neisseria sp. HSC-16F19]MCP2039676.1 UPF0755 protein [Neisseria sp. HSC-16F19]
MPAKIVRACVLLLLLLCLAVAGALFAPKNTPAYRLKVGKGQGMATVSRQLDADGVIYSRHVLLGAAYVMGVQDKLKAGSYRFPANVSSWRILKHLKSGHPDVVTVQIIEGQTFAQMRRIINNTADIRHDTQAWSDAELLRQIGAGEYSHGEGLFFPDSYDVDSDSSDLEIFKRAHAKMRRELQAAWDERQGDLPYRNPYELLTMASIIEKETGHPEDRNHVSAVFVNRLNIGMRLQTDPTVIYGMGAAYKGRIRKDDLRRDTPYNTYTRHGLPPTPIALPGKAALEAAAHPSQAQYLYFVSRMDGSGKSQFSHTLDEHNAAVRKYILKKGG